MIKSSALIIAGSDSGAGAGIQADLKTFSAHKVYATTVVTAITAQNTLGVEKVMNISTSMIEAQLKSISNDFKTSIIKIGMLSNSNIIEIISFCLKKYFSEIPVILDPVMIAKGGHNLLDIDSVECLKQKLFPKSYLITPNLPEAEKIIDVKINSVEDMKLNMKKFKEIKVKNVLLKGGHLDNKEIVDMLLTQNKVESFISSKINTLNTHGTGCTLSSAIACNLYKGLNLYDSVKNARNYVINGIKKACIIGKGHNPLNHFL